MDTEGRRRQARQPVGRRVSPPTDSPRSYRRLFYRPGGWYGPWREGGVKPPHSKAPSALSAQTLVLRWTPTATPASVEQRAATAHVIREEDARL